MPFPYKTVLITGATSGIGEALAERMISAGVFVIAVGRRQDRLDALLAKHGADKVAIDVFDVSDIQAIPAWAKKITAAHPTLDSIILNAGHQRTVDFTKPDDVSISAITSELHTNYLSPLATATAFLPHLTSLGASSSSPPPASIIFVSSGLALIPIPRCPNYCASKAAMHSLAWTMRSQLSAPTSPATHHIRVVEIVPPAVHTELHSTQPELFAGGNKPPGMMALNEFADETWELLRGEEELDEVIVKLTRDRFGAVETEKRKMFNMMVGMMRKMAEPKS